MVKCLETLELQGLKTFATMTRLEFPAQITAIVGPNGSGKSNIADSVRWVLGEQSYSILRAKRTEDMIFSGSQQKSRAGMASVTITFNNQTGWLPIDFSEVSISRRAYRDGQNEYLINGQKVRLKDVSELLAQTGLSERTYTIIGQGLVDVALALKPDERRKLFEEAAGIGLYRSRKEEAIRRLENTRKNLDRVLDIMTEIKPRLRSLEKQSTRFNEYQHVRSDLHLQLREWYGYHWHQKQQDLRYVRSSYQDQEKRLSTLRKKYHDAQVKVEDLRNQLKGKRKALEIVHGEISDYHRNLEQATRELAIIEERQRAYFHQKSNLEVDIANVEEEIKELKSQEEVFVAERENRLKDFDSAKNEVNQVNSQLTAFSEKNEDSETELQGVRKARISLEKEKVQVSAQKTELEHRVISLTNELEKINQSIQLLDRKKDLLKDEFEKKENAFNEAQHNVFILHEKVSAKFNQIQDALNKHQSIRENLSEKETRQAKLQTQLDVLIQAESALSGYSEGSKQILEDSHSGKLPDGIEPLSKYVLINEKLEMAIGAAFGELTDLLVVPSGSENLLIEYLESKKFDRVAFIPLDQLQTKKPDRKFSQISGILGYANDLIQSTPKFQQIINALFSDILVVQDKQVARRIQHQIEGYQKVVTLQGLVFHSNGVMISGQGKTGRRIGRTRRQKEMQQELKELQVLVNNLSKQQDENNARVTQLEEEHDELLQQLKVNEEKSTLERQAQQEAKGSLTQTIDQLAWHNERFLSIQDQINQTQSVIDSQKKQLVEINDCVETLLENETSLQKVINELPIFEIQQELNHWQTQMIVTENALNSANQRFEDYRNRIDNALKRLNIYQSRLDELEKGLKEVKQKNVLLKIDVDQFRKNINQNQVDRAEPTALVVEELEQKVSTLEKHEAHSHQQVIIAERQFTQLQLELTRRTDQLDNLRERIEDDFGLVSYDYVQKMDGPAPLPFDDGLIENLPRVQELPEKLEDEIKRLKAQIRRMGAINPEAQQEYYEVKERYEFLTNQIDDLEKASKDLREVIDTLDNLMEQDFIKTFHSVNEEFSVYFSRLFNGGEAKLTFIDQENPVEGGVDIEARLPGRRRQGLAVLSGGERSLTAVALIFALLKVSPTPFCILDEVDAMLDESNVGRFVELLRELSQKTQFIIITHNRNTVQAADVIYGVTMGRDSTSQMISLKLEDVDEKYLE